FIAHSGRLFKPPGLNESGMKTTVSRIVYVFKEYANQQITDFPRLIFVYVNSGFNVFQPTEALRIVCSPFTIQFSLICGKLLTFDNFVYRTPRNFMKGSRLFFTG